MLRPRAFSVILSASVFALGLGINGHAMAQVTDKSAVSDFDYIAGKVGAVDSSIKLAVNPATGAAFTDGKQMYAQTGCHPAVWQQMVARATAAGTAAANAQKAVLTPTPSKDRCDKAAMKAVETAAGAVKKGKQSIMAIVLDNLKKQAKNQATSAVCQMANNLTSCATGQLNNANPSLYGGGVTVGQCQTPGFICPGNLLDANGLSAGGLCPVTVTTNPGSGNIQGQPTNSGSTQPSTSTPPISGSATGGGIKF